MIDEQNVERCLLFPTLGDCVEGLMHDNVPMAYKVFHAFNLWLEEDWGYAYQRPPVRAAATSRCSIPTSPPPSSSTCSERA